MAKLIPNNVICRFDIPKCLVLDNDSPFVNTHVRKLLEGHVKSSHY